MLSQASTASLGSVVKLAGVGNQKRCSGQNLPTQSSSPRDHAVACNADGRSSKHVLTLESFVVLGKRRATGLRRVRVFMVYNLFPDFQDVNSWRRRGRILLFGIFKNKDSKDIKNQLQQQG